MLINADLPALASDALGGARTLAFSPPHFPKGGIPFTLLLGCEFSLFDDDGSVRLAKPVVGAE
jgi:hypothetical protein